MAVQHDHGKLGEGYAKTFLEGKGYLILATNWYHGKLELDIVARKENLLVIVEVKTRVKGSPLDPIAAVTLKKQNQLIKAADGYVQAHEWDGETRFDVIAVELSDGPPILEHIEEAFYPQA